VSLVRDGLTMELSPFIEESRLVQLDDPESFAGV
jgi:hypothetical protein